MSHILLITFLLFSTVIALAQPPNGAYKFDEYESNGGGGCLEYARVVDFAHEIIRQGNSKGLIVVYSGGEKIRLGNLLGYVAGVKRYLEERRFPMERISFAISDGRKFFNEEFWIIPENAETPNIKMVEFDWSELRSKYLFSTACLTCEPSYPQLTSFQPNYEDFVDVLKKNPQLKGLILVNNYWELGQVRRSLSNQKLQRSRFAIQLKKGPDEYSVNLFLIPRRS